MTNIEKMYNFLEDARDFFLSTVDGDTPRCRPIGFKSLYEGQFYTGIGDFKEVYRQLQVNPKIEIVALKGMSWIRINGKAVFDDDDSPVHAHMMEIFQLRSLYEKNGWKMKIFHIEDAEVQFIDVMTVKESFHI